MRQRSIFFVRLRKQAFTLVELLVVVAIISLLMSVMLPSLTRAQKQAEQAHCLANHHQLMVGWIQYALDQEDRICDPNGSEKIKKFLDPYIGDDDVFKCKTVEGTSRKEHYAINNTMGGNPRDGVLPYRKYQQVKQAAGQLVFVDAEPRNKAMIWPVLRDEELWYWRPWSWPMNSSLQGLTARHAGGFNRSFADGHGDYYRYSDIRTTQLIKGRLADPNEASLDNVDITNMLPALLRPDSL